MLVRATFPLLTVACVLTGCGHTVYSVRIPLVDDATPIGVGADAAHVVIVDARPSNQRKTHLGKDIWGCERWYGDESFEPAKLVYLDRRIAERQPVRIPVHVRLDRFDTVEYCQHNGNSGGAASARNSGAKGLPNFSPGAEMGDTVRLRLAGTVNGIPFDVSRSFDYGNLTYTFPESPSSNPAYRALMRDRLGQLVDEIVGKTLKP